MYLTAHIKSKAGRSEEMKNLLLDLVDGSKSETACLQYDLHQVSDNPDLFIFHEEWASREDWELHKTQPHILKFVQASAEIMDEETIIYQTEKVSRT